MSARQRRPRLDVGDWRTAVFGACMVLIGLAALVHLVFSDAHRGDDLKAVAVGFGLGGVALAMWASDLGLLDRKKRP